MFNCLRAFWPVSAEVYNTPERTQTIKRKNSYYFALLASTSQQTPRANIVATLPNLTCMRIEPWPLVAEVIPDCLLVQPEMSVSPVVNSNATCHLWVSNQGRMQQDMSNRASTIDVFKYRNFQNISLSNTNKIPPPPNRALPYSHIAKRRSLTAGTTASSATYKWRHTFQSSSSWCPLCRTARWTTSEACCARRTSSYPNSSELTKTRTKTTTTRHAWMESTNQNALRGIPTRPVHLHLVDAIQTAIMGAVDRSRATGSGACTSN